MAQVRTARLVERESFRDSALLRFAITDGEPLGFRGGQYVIVDTGLMLPDGKRRKRAYSLNSSEAQQHEFELGVYAVQDGLGAAYMLALTEGAELRFSGPWGKLVAPSLPSDRVDAQRTELSLTAADSERVWVLATDTGITAALGFVRGAAFAPWRARTTLCWWTARSDYFLSRAAVEARLPSGLALLEVRSPSVGSPERALALTRLLEAFAQDGLPSSVYVTGDGAAPAWVRAWLDARGLQAVPLMSENFFHHPVRKAALL